MALGKVADLVTKATIASGYILDRIEELQKGQSLPILPKEAKVQEKESQSPKMASPSPTLAEAV